MVPGPQRSLRPANWVSFPVPVPPGTFLHRGAHVYAHLRKATCQGYGTAPVQVKLSARGVRAESKVTLRWAGHLPSDVRSGVALNA